MNPHVAALTAQAGEWVRTPAYGIGLLIILAVLAAAGVIGRRLTKTKSQRRAEVAEANDIIVRNAERAGWGPPREPHHHGASGPPEEP